MYGLSSHTPPHMDGAIQVRIGNCPLRHFNTLFENKESQNRRKKGKMTSEIARESTQA
jgi:hypothetical protein